MPAGKIIFKENIFFLFLVVWNLLLTVIFVKIWSHYQRLTQNVSKENLQKVLEAVLKQLKGQEKNSREAKASLAVLENEGKKSFQKMGLVRFNPFAEMGGNQSFSFVLLDAHNSGFIITSLHGRALTRLYLKRVKQGKAIDGKLSKEEELAIKQVFKREG